MLITATNDIKKDMVITTPAAGLLAPGAAELVVWIGATAKPDVSARNGIELCLQGLREADTPGAAYGAEVPVKPDGSTKPDVVVAAGAPTVTDNDVAIAYGASFKNNHQSITPVVKRAMEKFIEANKAV